MARAGKNCAISFLICFLSAVSPVRCIKAVRVSLAQLASDAASKGSISKDNLGSVTALCSGLCACVPSFMSVAHLCLAFMASVESVEAQHVMDDLRSVFSCVATILCIVSEVGGVIRLCYDIISRPPSKRSPLPSSPRKSSSTSYTCASALWQQTLS